MQKIYKFPLENFKPGERFTIKSQFSRTVPVFSFQLQDGVPTIWALFDSNEREREIEFMTIGTGWELPETYAGFPICEKTIQLNGFVWHLLITKWG